MELKRRHALSFRAGPHLNLPTEGAELVTSHLVSKTKFNHLKM